MSELEVSESPEAAGPVFDNTTLPHPRDGFRAANREGGGRIYLEVQLYCGGKPVWQQPRVILNQPDAPSNYPVRARLKIVVDALCRWFTLGGTEKEVRYLLRGWPSGCRVVMPDHWRLWGVESDCAFSYVFSDADAQQFFRWTEDEFVERYSQADLLEDDDGCNKYEAPLGGQVGSAAE